MAKEIRQVPPDMLHFESDAGSSLQRQYYPGNLKGKAHKAALKALRIHVLKFWNSRCNGGFQLKNEPPWLRSVKLTEFFN